MDFYRDYSAENIVKQEMDKLRAEARINNPDEPEVLAVQKAAIKKAEENINSKGSHKKKIQTAAGTFMGFYLVNYRQRTAFCNKKGVDISSFTNAFKDSHINEYSTAVNALSYNPSEVDELYSMLKPQLEIVIVQDMEHLAKESGVSLSEACQLISDNAAIIVPQMHISIMQPIVHKTLMSEM